MSPFLNEFPETVDIDGEPHEILTDFRDFLWLIEVLEDEDNDLRKADAILAMYKDPLKIPRDKIKEAILAIGDFILGGEHSEEGEEDDKKPTMSFTQDAPYIIGDFLRYYRIDLMTVDYLHWHRFRLLMVGLPEDSETKTRIGYRSIDLSSIKDKEERKRIQKIKRSVALKEKAPDAYDIGDLFGGDMW